MIIELEDGRKVELPDGSSPQEVDDVVSHVTQQRAPTPTAQPAKQTVAPASALESVARGGYQGATFGYGDEIMAAGGTAAARLLRPDLFEGESIADTYRKGRDIVRQDEAVARESNPWWYGGGQVAGAITTGMKLPMPASGAPRYLAGMGYGGVAGYGSTEATTPSGQALDTGLGVLGGAGGTYVGDKLAKGVAALANTGRVQAAKDSVGKMFERFYTPAAQPAVNAAAKSTLPEDQAIVEAMRKGATREEAEILTRAKGFGVPLSRGDVTRTAEQQGLEDLALRGALTDDATRTALAFRQQQEQALRDSAKGVINKLTGTPYVDDLSEVGTRTAQRLTELQRAEKDAVGAAYKAVRSPNQPITAETYNPTNVKNVLYKGGDISNTGPNFFAHNFEQAKGYSEGGRKLAGYTYDPSKVLEVGSDKWLRMFSPKELDELDAMNQDLFTDTPKWVLSKIKRSGYAGITDGNDYTRLEDLAKAGVKELPVAKQGGDIAKFPTPYINKKLGEVFTELEQYPLDTMPNTKVVMNQAQKIFAENPNGQFTPQTDLIKLENFRKFTGRAKDSVAMGNKTDAEGIRLVRDKLDNMIDEAIEQNLITGDPKSISQLKQARGMAREYFQRWEADDAIQKIVSENNTPEQVINLVRGYGQVGGNKQAALLVDKLGGILGKDSEEFGLLKQAQLRQIFGKNLDSLLRGDVQKGFSAEEVRKNLTNLINNNRSLANAYFSPQEQQVLKNFLDVAYRATNRVAGSVNYSNTTPALVRWSRQFANQFGMLGRLAGAPGELVAQGMGGIKKGVEGQRAIDSFSKEFNNPNNPFANALRDRLTQAADVAGANLGGQAPATKQRLKVTIRPNGGLPPVNLPQVKPLPPESYNQLLKRFYA